jgi:pimeloyl-ACP methyl ester carboxylesterase
MNSRVSEMAPDGIILVHGGLHTAACWGPVLPLLDLPVRAVDLPGRGSRPADVSLVGLDDCVAAVIDEADSAGFSRFALIGHSLAGVTITETAFRHPERIARLVYVAALVPSLGSTAALLMTGAEMAGTMTMSEDTARPMFGNDLTDEQWVEHAKSLVPDAIGIMNARLSGYPAGIPITYVNMTRDVPVPPALAEQMAANLGPGVERFTIDAGHTVMVSQPKALAEIINRVTAR